MKFIKPLFAVTLAIASITTCLASTPDVTTLVLEKPTISVELSISELKAPEIIFPQTEITSPNFTFSGQYVFTSNREEYSLLLINVGSMENAFGIQKLNLEFNLLAGEERYNKTKTTGLELGWTSPGSIVVHFGGAFMVKDKSTPFFTFQVGFGLRTKM